ncbi:alpha/beta fold hydrolase [Pseudonocardia xinjiangensis]|uniref:Alpha/beta fold hydrolase n=1 Tax=Pseudonocardia xinjiangensis TaxID=75289 RepID=A0ABX1RRJ4_9PSEU|nr:alpha/beta fold hydrolase [Pseudonocardia xinjiangensis]NMH82259.1 alpha/beta fold hydrolase [Pseudonocardia xinjiangensis]
MTAAPLHVRTFGPSDGVPVLALHGITGHSARWRVLAEALPEFRFIAVDLRGHGRSPWTPPWNIEQHVSDALGVLDAFDLQRVRIAGHSYGGAISVHLSRTAPDRVERLVLLDPAIGLDPQDMLETAESSRADESFPDIAMARADRAQRWEGIADELVDAEIAEHLVRDGDRYRYRYCGSTAVVAWAEMARPALTPPAGTPTLLLPATKADFVSPAWVDACRAELGDALTVTEVDAGHMVYLERTAEVAQAMREFLTP